MQVNRKWTNNKNKVIKKGNTNDSNMKRCPTSVYNNRNAIKGMMSYFFFLTYQISKGDQDRKQGVLSKVNACEPKKWILYFQELLCLDFRLFEEMEMSVKSTGILKKNLQHYHSSNYCKQKKKIISGC